MTATHPVVYIPDLVRSHEDAYERLMADLPWRRHDLPRDEVYFNDTPAPYTYGAAGRERTYEPEALWHPTVLDIRAMVEEATIGAGCGSVMDVCFINRYMDARDSLGWHADDSPEMDPARPIVTVSLGSEREILFRPAVSKPVLCHVVNHAEVFECWLPAGHRSDHDPTRPVESLSLAPGSAAIMMPGMQQEWQHRIPKSSVSNIGPRISLTFRGYLPQ